MKNKFLIFVGVILIGGTVYIGYNYNSQKNNGIVDDIGKNYQNGDKNIVLNINSDLDSIYDNSNIKQLEERSDLIIIGTVNRIDGATNYIPKLDQYMMISTIGTIKVNNIIKGNDIVSKDSEIQFFRHGGIISISEYEKSLEPRQIIRQGLDKMTKEEKEESYVKQSVNGDIEIDENSTYLMYLKYNEDLDRYNIIGYEYGLREYNVKTNQVKNNTNNSWEAIQYNIK